MSKPLLGIAHPNAVEGEEGEDSEGGSSMMLVATNEKTKN